MLRDTFQQGVEDLRARSAKGTLADDARALVRLRGELEAEEERLATSRLDLARRYLQSEPECIEVPAAEFDAWLQGDAAP